jgi:hypothetical protein
LERFGIRVGCRPIGCHDLVRYFTQEQGIGLSNDPSTSSFFAH